MRCSAISLNIKHSLYKLKKTLLLLDENIFPPNCQSSRDGKMSLSVDQPRCIADWKVSTASCNKKNAPQSLLSVFFRLIINQKIPINK